MKPMLFNTDMVRALLAGQKTVTRRVVKREAVEAVLSSPARREKPDVPDAKFIWCLCNAPCETGDILYVRETWCDPTPNQSGYPVLYKADMPMHWDAEDTECGAAVTLQAKDYKWHPSIHMPKEAARIFLRVTDVRVERLQDITDKQALAEGVPDDCDYPLESPVCCPVCKGSGLIGAVHPVSLGYMEVDCPHCDTPRKRFLNLWDSTIKPADRARYGWDANPWVWVIEFERITKEEAALRGDKAE